MKKPNPTVFQVSIPANDASFLFSPLSMREMESFTKREEEVVKTGDLNAKRDLYRELIARSLTKAGDTTSPDDVAELDAPTFNALFNEIMKAHGMSLKAETSPGEIKASANS